MLLLQVIVGGLLLGAIYALFSSGLTLIWGIMNFINFAHGEFVMLGIVQIAVIALVSLSLFVWIELTVEKPLIRLRLLKGRNFGFGTISVTLLGFALERRFEACALLRLTFERRLAFDLLAFGFGRRRLRLLAGALFGLAFLRRFSLAFLRRLAGLGLIADREIQRGFRRAT